MCDELSDQSLLVDPLSYLPRDTAQWTLKEIDLMIIAIAQWTLKEIESDEPRYSPVDSKRD